MRNYSATTSRFAHVSCSNWSEARFDPDRVLTAVVSDLAICLEVDRSRVVTAIEDLMTYSRKGDGFDFDRAMTRMLENDTKVCVFETFTPSEQRVLVELLEFATSTRLRNSATPLVFVYHNLNAGRSVAWTHIVGNVTEN